MEDVAHAEAVCTRPSPALWEGPGYEVIEHHTFGTPR